MCVLLFDVFSECSFKETNMLISKGMPNIYYWEKLMLSKLVRKVKKCTGFEDQEGIYKVYSGKHLF